MQFRHIAAAAVFAYLFIVTCPIRHFALIDDLDASWVFAVNFAAANGLRFGHDLVWTSGPLAWIACPMAVGANLEWATLVQASLWAGMLGALILLWRKGYTGLANLAWFGLFLTAPVFAEGYFGVDTYTVVVIILLLAYGTVSAYWRLVFAVSALLTGALFLVKFTAGLMAAGAMAGFASSLALDDLRKATAAAILGALGVTAVVVSYFSVVQFPADILGYLRGSYELASGYSIAMGIAGRFSDLYWAVAAPLPAAGLFLVLYRRGLRAWRCVWMFPIPLFLAFKHGFVRHDGHVVIYFAFVLIMTAVALIITPFAKIPRLLPPAVAVAAIGLWVLSLMHYEYWRHADPIAKVKRTAEDVGRAIDPKVAGGTLRQESFAAADRRALAVETRRMIGGNIVGSLSPTFAYAYAGAVNWRPLPVPQTYSAYTPWLDHRIANRLERGDFPYLVAEWLPIDGRNMLADVPATWLAVYRWFDVAEQSSERLLLRKRDQPRFNHVRTLQKTRWKIDERMPLPGSGGRPLIASIRMRLNTDGHLRKALFRVPDVWLNVTSLSRGVQTFRVIPDVLSSGLLVNVLPGSLNDVSAALSRSWSSNAEALFVSGPGRRFYNREVEVEFAEISDVAP